MVVNCAYWRCVYGASKWIFATIKSIIDAVKFQIQYSYRHFNVIMCRIDMHTCIFPYYWQDDASGNQLKINKNISCYFNRGIDTVKITPLNRQFSYLHSNVIMCIATLLTRWSKRQSFKILMIFNRGIDTKKITALSNHKPGILNNYIRI
jgi:hypothetical protein